jgi:hypothetical protein
MASFVHLLFLKLFLKPCFLSHSAGLVERSQIEEGPDVMVKTRKVKMLAHKHHAVASSMEANPDRVRTYPTILSKDRVHSAGKPKEGNPKQSGLHDF